MIYGDVNNNGTVDAADAKLAKSLIDTVPTEEELTAAFHFTDTLKDTSVVCAEKSFLIARVVPGVALLVIVILYFSAT